MASPGEWALCQLYRHTFGCRWRVFTAGASADSQQVVVAPAVTTTAVRLTSTHERSVDVSKWRRADIDVWLDSNDLKHLAHW